MSEQQQTQIKWILGVQLIAENYQNLIKQSPKNGMSALINNLGVQCVKIESKFWDNMDEDAELYFQDLVKQIEVQIK